MSDARTAALADTWVARTIGDPWVAFSVAFAIVVLGALFVVVRRNRSAELATNGARNAVESKATDPEPEPTLDELLAPIDRMLPLGTFGFLALVAAFAIAFWATGYWLTGARDRFLASPEWRFQPIYIAVHFITLRLFVSVFSRNFRKGVTYLDVTPEDAVQGMRRLLGPLGALGALLISAPFCYFDYLYLYSPRYTKLEQDDVVRGIDLMMWGIWCTEWFLNAFIWIILIGFLVKNCRLIQGHRFRAPVEVVLQAKHYRPFLQMSSQGATILLVFSIVSVIYVAYTGGALTDYVGLLITVFLLIIGFLIPWSLLRRKVRQMVRNETAALQGEIAGADWTVTTVPGSGSPRHAAAQIADLDVPLLAKRLAQAIALLRIGNLERLHQGLGSAEARAVLVRVLAPLVTILWQLSQNSAAMLEKAKFFLQLFVQRLQGLL
jgi:hypothetical protein